MNTPSAAPSPANASTPVAEGLSTPASAEAGLNPPGWMNWVVPVLAALGGFTLAMIILGRRKRG